MLKKITFTLFVLVTVLMCASLTVADLVTDGLVAYWSLDANTISGSDVKDVVGGNNGTITGNLVQVTGKVNGALEFDGASSVDVVGTDALRFSCLYSGIPPFLYTGLRNFPSPQQNRYLPHFYLSAGRNRNYIISQALN